MRVMERISLLAPRDEELSFDVYQLHQKFLPVPPQELLEAEAKRVKENYGLENVLSSRRRRRRRLRRLLAKKARRGSSRGARSARGRPREFCCCVCCCARRRRVPPGGASSEATSSVAARGRAAGGFAALCDSGLDGGGGGRAPAFTSGAWSFASRFRVASALTALESILKV